MGLAIFRVPLFSRDLAGSLVDRYVKVDGNRSFAASTYICDRSRSVCDVEV